MLGEATLNGSVTFLPEAIRVLTLFVAQQARPGRPRPFGWSLPAQRVAGFLALPPKRSL